MSILAHELVLDLVRCADAEYGIALDVRGRLDGLRDASKTVLLAFKVLLGIYLYHRGCPESHLLYATMTPHGLKSVPTAI